MFGSSISLLLDPFMVSFMISQCFIRFIVHVDKECLQPRGDGKTLDPPYVNVSKLLFLIRFGLVVVTLI